MKFIIGPGFILSLICFIHQFPRLWSLLLDQVLSCP